MDYSLLPYGLIFSAILIATAGLLALTSTETIKKMPLFRGGFQDILDHNERMVFLFSDNKIKDATSTAKRFLTDNGKSKKMSDWTALMKQLSARYKEDVDQLDDLQYLGSLSLVSHDGNGRLEAQWQDGTVRIELFGEDLNNDQRLVDRLSYDAMQEEIDSLRMIAAHVPVMVWRENHEGAINWANNAYLDVASQRSGGQEAAIWPPEKLFSHNDASKDGTQNSPWREELQATEGTEAKCFDVFASKCAKDTLYTAVPVDNIAQSGDERADLVQILTKTFAHLPVGLTIFDKDRQLIIFNPAVMDLLDLRASFLVRKPTLPQFLTELREKYAMPEAADAVSLRQEVSKLEAAAVNGTFSKTWSFASGQTYRVTGRPHTGGALALLFEDISSKLSLDHQFNFELEMGRAALNHLDDAVAIFNTEGELSTFNPSYAAFCKDERSSFAADCKIKDAMKSWRRQCADPMRGVQWQKEMDRRDKDHEWRTSISLKGGRVVTCVVTPIMEGATMVRFCGDIAKPQVNDVPKRLSSAAGA
jgi:PAS domain-containing protein